MSTDSESNSMSSGASIDVSSSNDEVSMHSTISGDSQLDDHRNQEMSMPIRTNSMVAQNFSHSQDHFTHHQNENNTNNDQIPEEKNESLTSSPILLTGNSRKTKRTLSHSSTSGINPLSAIPGGPAKVNINSNVNSRDLLNRMVVVDDDYDEYAVKFNDRYKNNNSGSAGLSFASDSNTPVPLNITDNRRKSKSRSKSFSEQVKSFIRPKEESVTAGGILLTENNINNNIEDDRSILSNPQSRNDNKSLNVPFEDKTFAQLSKVISRASSRSTRRKVPINNDNDSDIDSHASRESQETEEDVCFPMLPEHVRIRGIDFDEIEEFIIEQREENERIALREKELRLGSNHSITTSTEKPSSAALKYIPKNQSSSETSVKSGFDNNNKESNSNSTINNTINNNYMNNTYNNNSNNNNGNNNYYYNNNNNNSNNNNQYDYNENVTFNPEGNIQEDEELPTRFSFFSSEREETIHAADIPSLVLPEQPVKELFEPEDSIWWLDCTCPTDSEMKMLAKAFGIHPLTAEDIRMQETREKVELFKSYYFVSFHTFETDIESEDFLEPINVYLVVFRSGILTFHFSPIINPTNVRRRVRQLRDYVNVSADWLCYAMIDDITDGFAPIIQSIEYEADAIEDSVFLSTDNDFGRMLLKIGESRRKVMTLMRLLQGKADVIKMFAKRCQDEAGNNKTNNPSAQPRGDIALYLGDIQDHIITMFQSLLSYEKIFSRSHSNYLAQLQVESFYSNVRVTDMLSKVTLLGTILIPMNLVTGLFGMNVKVPGNGQTNYGWFGGIIGFIFFMIFLSAVCATLYLRHIENKARGHSILKSGLSIKSFRIGGKKEKDLEEGSINNHNKGIMKYGKRNKDDKKNDTISLPTRFTRYGDW